MQQGMPNRLGLGLRPPLPSYGQGPSISALAQQQHIHHQQSTPQPKSTTLFIGSISGGITDAFLNQLLAVRLQPRVCWFMKVQYCFYLQGLRAYIILQTSHHTSQQTPRLRLRRVSRCRRGYTSHEPVEWSGVTCAGRWLCQQETFGASVSFLTVQFTPTSYSLVQVKADEKTKMFLDAYQAQKMKTDVRYLCFHCKVSC